MFRHYLIKAVGCLGRQDLHVRACRISGSGSNFSLSVLDSFVLAHLYSHGSSPLVLFPWQLLLSTSFVRFSDWSVSDIVEQPLGCASGSFAPKIRQPWVQQNYP